MNNINGNKAEAKFISEAVGRGLIISKPVVSEEKYDYIVDNGNELLKVQVKSTYRFDEQDSRYKINTNYGGGNKKLYTNKDIDFFAIYIAECDVWYFISIEDISTKTINVYPHRKNNGTLERFKNNWELIGG